MKRILFIFALWFVTAKAAFEVQIALPELIGIAQISCFHIGGLNPAATPETSKIQGSIGYGNLFGIKGLQNWNSTLGRQLGAKTYLKFAINSLGNEIYQENSYSLNYARKIRNGISLGAAVHIYNLVIVNYERTSAAGLSLGGFYKISETLTMAMYLRNFNSPKICDKQEPLPQIFSCGVAYSPIQMIHLNAELYKDTLFPFVSKLGIKLQPLQFFYCMAGIGLNPDYLTAGFGVSFSKLTITAAIKHHMTLPDTIYLGTGIAL